MSTLSAGTAFQDAGAEIDDAGRRSQIVHAAATVLGRQGYGATSLKDVAREAGVAPGLLHYYFESKEELLLEVVVVVERQMIADWKEAIAGIEDPLERMVAGLDQAEARCAEQPESFRLMLDLYTAGLSSPALRVRCAELCSHLVDLIEVEVGFIEDRAHVVFVAGQNRGRGHKLVGDDVVVRRRLIGLLPE